MAVLAVFLLLGGNTRDSVLFILGSWLVILAVSMGAAYMCRRKQMDTLLESVNQLEEKYLIAEVTGLPERADDRVFYQVMKAAEKSMLERIGNMQREQKEYREYIEQWVHEMKTPITAMKLLCENHLSEFTRQFPVELEKSNRLTEQVQHSTFTPAMFLAGAVTSALPGIAVQIMLIPILVLTMQKAKLILK